MLYLILLSRKSADTTFTINGHWANCAGLKTLRRKTFTKRALKHTLYIDTSRCMDKTNALAAFQALSQETRLDVFRLLMRAGPAGMAAGDIAETCDVRQNTMSSHLSILSSAGLITATRDGRSVRYSASLSGIKGLLAFLMEDCCGGKPEQCQPFLREIALSC